MINTRCIGFNFLVHLLKLEFYDKFTIMYYLRSGEGDIEGCYYFLFVFLNSLETLKPEN